MRMHSIHISIHLDANLPIKNVQKFVLNDAFEGCFKPLYYFHPNKTGPDIELLDY